MNGAARANRRARGAVKHKGCRCAAGVPAELHAEARSVVEHVVHGRHTRYCPPCRVVRVAVVVVVVVVVVHGDDGSPCG